MNIKKISFALAAFAGVLAARAGVVTFTNEALFQSQGAIAFNSNFDDFGTGYGFPSNPFTRGDVTYHSAENITWGSNYTTTRPLIGNNYWTPILGSIATGPQYDMFGFEIATWNTSPITIKITTNLNTYTYPSLTIADSMLGLLDFKGFSASSGEYFTDFQIIVDNGAGGSGLPGLTNVQVGHTGASVPDNTSSIALVGATFLGLMWVRRYKHLEP